MNNKEIQEKRMKEYFIQATKNILKGEGLKGISVRNIAKQAGYSYATLYNYFKDVNDLVFICVNDFQEECKLFVSNKVGKESKGIDRLKQTIFAYVSYFVEYPGIFDLFFLAKGGDFGNKKTIIELISHSMDDVCKKEWDNCIKHKIFPVHHIENLKSQLRYSIIGILLLYLNRLTPESYSEFINQVNTQLDFQLGIKENYASTNIRKESSKVQNSLISVNISK